MTQLSIYQLLDYNIPLLINYRSHHLLQLHTRAHLQHKHLKKKDRKPIMKINDQLIHTHESMISMLWHERSSKPFKRKRSIPFAPNYSTSILEWLLYIPAFLLHMFISATCFHVQVTGLNTSTLFLTKGPSWPPTAYSKLFNTPTPVNTWKYSKLTRV